MHSSGRRICAALAMAALAMAMRTPAAARGSGVVLQPTVPAQAQTSEPITVRTPALVVTIVGPPPDSGARLFITTPRLNVGVAGSTAAADTGAGTTVNVVTPKLNVQIAHK